MLGFQGDLRKIGAPSLHPELSGVESTRVRTSFRTGRQWTMHAECYTRCTDVQVRARVQMLYVQVEGPIVLQVVTVINAAAPSYQQRAVPRTLLLRVTDGHSTVSAVEHVPMPGLS